MRSCPSHASRPYTLTRRARPSGVSASDSATPPGSSGACRRPVASTPRSASARGDLIEREPSRGRAEDQMDDGAGGESHQEARHHPDRERDGEGDPRDGPDPDDPPPDEAERAAHVRRGHHDDRGRDREPHGEVDGGAARRGEGLEAGPRVRPGQSPRQHRQSERERSRQELEEDEPLAASGEQRQQQEDQRPPDQEVVRDLPEPPEEPGELVHHRRHRPVDRRRSRGRERQQGQAEDGQDEQHDVGRPARDWARRSRTRRSADRRSRRALGSSPVRPPDPRASGASSRGVVVPDRPEPAAPVSVPDVSPAWCP